MERLTYKTNGKHLNTTAEQAPPYAIDCDIDTAITKLAEYEDLEEQNRLIKLTCAVGDTVYEICEGFIEPCTIETIFLADYKDKAGNSSYMMEIFYDREDCPWVSTEVYFTDIGKTVFLTKEEAESALKELERDKEMSNDLISRSALMQSLRNNVLVDVTPNLEQAIAEQPTADYVDKVIEQLEENAKYFQSEADELAQVGNWGTATELQGKAAAYRDAAKTVKSGGIE